MLISKNPKVICVYGGTPIKEINAIPELVEELKKMDEKSKDSQGLDEDSDEGEAYYPIYLGKNKKRVQEIGERIEKAGGYDLMLWAVKQIREEVQHELECAWDGIGDWQL